jgi:hypothetical protein
MPGPLRTRAAAGVIAAPLLGAVVFAAPALAQEEPAPSEPASELTLAAARSEPAPKLIATPATPVVRTPSFTG